MERKGVRYDVGREMYGNWRPDFYPRVVHRELEIIKNDLHCNAVRISGRDIGRLTLAGQSHNERRLGADPVHARHRRRADAHGKGEERHAGRYRQGRQAQQASQRLLGQGQ